MHYGRNRTLDRGKTRDTNLPQKRRNALKMVILTKKSKIFIKAKLTVSKSCLLGPAYFMIYCILEDAHLQNLSFLRGLSTEFIFFNFSDTATYSRKLENQNQKLLIFLILLSIAIVMRQFRISQEKHLPSGFQNSNPQKTSFLY